MHVLSSGLAPRAALGGQNFRVRARGWFFGFIHLLIFEHIQNHSNVCAKVNSDIVSACLCVAGHRILHSAKGRQGSAFRSAKVSDACLCERLSVSLVELLGYIY